MNISHLPQFDLNPVFPIAAQFAERGARDFHAAAAYIRELPYGRNSDRANYHLVLAEGRGTCSTKHALLAALAGEHGVSIGLMIGVYEMNERNTPGVGAILEAHGLDAIPEAHCYLRCGISRIDLTRAIEAMEPIEFFLHEEEIAPEQIGDYKIALHRRVMTSWGEQRGGELSELWNIREKCIRGLADARS